MQKLRFSKYFKGIVILLDIFIIAFVFVFFFISETGNFRFKM